MNYLGHYQKHHFGKRYTFLVEISTPFQEVVNLKGETIAKCLISLQLKNNESLGKKFYVIVDYVGDLTYTRFKESEAWNELWSEVIAYE